MPLTRLLRRTLFGSMLLIGCLTLSLAACANRRPVSPSTPPLLFPQTYGDFYDLRGIMHVHSNYSKDSEGSMERIVKAAADTGLDFVIITDHDTLAGRSWQGSHDGVLLLIDEEVDTHEGHLLALNISEPIPPNQAASKAIQQIVTQGGLAFVAHPFGKRRWEEWGIDRFTGIEIHNVASDAYWLENKMFTALRLFFVYPFDNQYVLIHSLDYPRRNTALWDRLMVDQDRPIVGIAGNNVHYNFTLFGHYVDNYRDFFRLVETHLLVRERSAEGIYEALEAGRVYVVFRPFLKRRQVLFTARSRTKKATLGETLPLDGPIAFEVKVNRRSRIRLVQNGEIVREVKGTRLHYQSRIAGFYRIEVLSHGHPVILTNPIQIAETTSFAEGNR